MRGVGNLDEVHLKLVASQRDNQRRHGRCSWVSSSRVNLQGHMVQRQGLCGSYVFT